MTQYYRYLLSDVVCVGKRASVGGVQREFRQKYKINVAKTGQNQILALLLCMFYSGMKVHNYLISSLN